MAQIVSGETDDPNIIQLLNDLVEGFVADRGPERVSIIQIDNWFDHKWLRFSDNGAIASEVPIDRWDTVIGSETSRVECWFAAFKRENKWALYATKCADNTDVERFLVKTHKD